MSPRRTPTTRLLLLSSLALLGLCLGCGGGKKKDTTAEAAAVGGKGAQEAPVVDDGLEPGSPESARALVARLADPATRSATVLGLEPSHEDYVAVYGEAFGSELEKLLRGAWTKHQIVPSPWGPDQTEVQLSRGSSEDFRAWQGEARKFPRGYKRIAEFMQPDQVFYQFRFLKPGEAAGANWDGLVWVGGKWKLFPKPFNAAPEGSSFYREL